VVAEISPTGLVRTYHAGDSVAYLFGQRGAMKAATMAHNPAAYAVEAGLISEDEAHDHAERSMLTNCLGVEGLRIEIGGQIPLARRDTLLLASDGITDNLTRDEIVEICRKGPLDRCAETLVRSAVARMTAPEDGLPSKPDDATAVLFRLPK
jgi:protein phosphatase